MNCTGLASSGDRRNNEIENSCPATGTPLGKTRALPAKCISQVHFGRQVQTFCCSPFQVGELKVSSTVTKKEEKCPNHRFRISEWSLSATLILSTPDVSLLPSSFQVFRCLLLTAPRSIKHSRAQSHLPRLFQRITDYIFLSVEL